MPRALVFDFNGVIVDDERHHCSSLVEVLNRHGIAADADRFRREFLGLDDRTCFRRALGSQANRQTIEKLLAAKRSLYRTRLREDFCLVPGVADFICAAASEYPLGLVSGAPREEVDQVLDQAGLADRFTVIVTVDDVTCPKPHPEGYARAVQGLGVGAAVTVAFEDSPPGVQAARAAGLRCVLLTTSYDAAEIPEADDVWSSFVGRRPAHVFAHGQS